MSVPSCWCWQYGRCLVDCPTAGHPRPRPFVDSTWKSAALELMHNPRPVPDQEGEA